MIIEYALLIGAAGVNAAQLIAVAARNKRKLDFKESTDQLNALRNNITDSLIELGALKLDCCKNEIKTFLEYHDELVKDSKKKVIFQGFKDPLEENVSDNFGKRIDEISKKICSCKNRDLDREKVSLAVCSDESGLPMPGLVAGLAGPLFIAPILAFTIQRALKRTFPNPTIAWITYPLFSEKVNDRDNSMILNGAIDEFVLAATNYPHSMQTEKQFRRYLKDEEKRKEIGANIEEAFAPLEELKSRIVEITLCIKAERERLSQINKRIEQILEMKNETEYAYSLSEKIILEGLGYLIDLVTLIRLPFIEYNGMRTESLQSYMENETFQNRVVSTMDFDKFDKYYRDCVDIYTVKEEDLSEYNIKIIYSEIFDKKARFMYYYKNNPEKRWIDCSAELALCYDERFTNFTEQTIDFLVKQLSEDLTLGAYNTTIYFLGEKALFRSLYTSVDQKYKNIKIIYMGDGVDEK